jgi:hypothetical protein
MIYENEAAQWPWMPNTSITVFSSGVTHSKISVDYQNLSDGLQVRDTICIKLSTPVHAHLVL